jgi:sugar-specific transcriptional regulator TrmB
VNGFAIAFRRENLPAVIVDRLQSQIDVLTRLWSITHDEEVKEAIEETVEHANHTITEFDHYRDFLEDHFKDLRRAVKKDSGATLASDPFGLFDALNQLKTSIKSNNPTALTVAHDVLLQRFAHLTWRQKSPLPIP